MRIQIMLIAVVLVLMSGSFAPLFGMQPGRGGLAGRRPLQAGPARQQDRRVVRWQDEEYDDGGPRGVKRARVSDKEEEEEGAREGDELNFRAPYHYFVEGKSISDIRGLISKVEGLNYDEAINALENMLQQDAEREKDGTDFLTTQEAKETQARIEELRQLTRQAAAPAPSGRSMVRTAAAVQEDPRELLKELKALLATSENLQANYQEEKTKREKRLAELQKEREDKRAELNRLEDEKNRMQAFLNSASAIEIEFNDIVVKLVEIDREIATPLPAKKGWFRW